jgi:hypothetical protein
MNSDNRFGVCCKCPARMSDGRIFTNWLPRKRLNEFLRLGNNLESAHDYRHFLQNNANQLIGSEIKYLEDNKKCSFKK